MAKTYQFIVAMPDDMEPEELKRFIEEDCGRPVNVLDTKKVQLLRDSRPLMEQIFGKTPFGDL